MNPGFPHQEVKNVAQAHKMWATPDKVNEPLYAIVPLTNFWRSKARWKNFLRAIEHFQQSGATVIVIEAALHEREHAVDLFMPHRVLADAPAIDSELAPNCCHDDPYRGQHRYIRVRAKEDHGIWLKENLINIAVGYLPSDWKYVCWLDGDLLFARPNWVGETIHMLQQYKMLQMFSQAQDVGPDYAIHNCGMNRPGFIYGYLQEGQTDFTGQLSHCSKRPMRDRDTNETGYYYGKAGWGWSGLAWACRREAWDAFGGLPDFGIHGGMDWHTAFALVGQVKLSIHSKIHPNYLKKLLLWQELCDRHIRRSISYVSGTVLHYWHGQKINRKYADRHALLAETQFDPDRDLVYDSQGLLHLEDDGSERILKLRDGLKRYAITRNEDSIEQLIQPF